MKGNENINIGWNRNEKIFNLKENLWDYRVEKMASYLPPTTKSIMDLGAGGGHLKKYIDANIKYYPVDYIEPNLEEPTIICDFNKGEFPIITVDCIFMSGILEYIANPELFIRMVCERCEVVVLSYNSALDCDKEEIYKREKCGWISHLSKEQVIGCFKNNRFNLVICEKNDEYPETYFKFEKLRRR